MKKIIEYGNGRKDTKTNEEVKHGKNHNEKYTLQ